MIPTKIDSIGKPGMAGMTSGVVVLDEGKVTVTVAVLLGVLSVLVVWLLVTSLLVLVDV
jgi:hypothetical protein